MKTEVDGAYHVEGEDHYRCNKCKRDDAFKYVMHLDGKDFYKHVYNCECGNVLTMTYHRNKGTMWE